MDRAKIELVCLGRALMPDDESLDRTVATLTLFAVWAGIVLGPMFTHADPPRYEIVVGVTSVVFLILGRMWGIEVERILDGITISAGGDRSDEDD
ncbi:hypothetical protein [Salinilacihabitans rarus]|uniref:hypothetical protein n=1 Tax=Salinilacihabitans rarus TaxID=2961596 RepID=UPI0020C867EC|nr:hypothetical protein [Salinilacihabitans rarus]